MSPAFFQLLLAAVRPSTSCVAMRPKDFDDVMPLTRIPPTNPLWTSSPIPPTTTTVPTTTTIAGTTTTTSATTTTTLATTSTAGGPDPCDACPLPTVIPVSETTTACAGTTPATNPDIQISAMTDGNVCTLVVTGCALYQILYIADFCNLEPLSPAPVCQNGEFLGEAGLGIARIRCYS